MFFIWPNFVEFEIFEMQARAVLRPVKGVEKVDLEDPAAKPYITDNGNYILDLYFDKPVPDAQKAADELTSMVGVVEHGFFLQMADAVVIATSDGVQVRTQGQSEEPQKIKDKCALAWW